MSENDRIIQMIISLREQHGLNQTEMAKKIGMYQNNYSRIESGKHKITLQKLSEILDVFDLQIGFVEKPH